MSSGGAGKELLGPSSSDEGKLYGFGAQPPVNLNNPNARIELLPSNGSGSGSGSGSRLGRSGSGGVGAMRTPRGFQAEPGSRSLVQSGVNAALGLNDGRLRIPRRGGGGGGSRELLPSGSGNGMYSEGGASQGSSNGVGDGGSRLEAVSILGAGRTSVLVKVENLAAGTTAEDVMVSDKKLTKTSCFIFVPFSISGVRR